MKPGEEVVFIPTHTVSNPCNGKVFTVEMHHKRVDAAHPGDNVGMNIKGLDKGNMPRTGDVMIYKKDQGLKAGAYSRPLLAQLEPCLTQKSPYTPYTPTNTLLRWATQPLRAPPIRYKALMLS